MFGYSPFGFSPFGYGAPEAPITEPGGPFIDIATATIMSAATTITTAQMSSADTISIASF